VKPGSNKNQFPLWPIESHGHSYVVHKDGIQNFLYYPHMKDWLYRTTVNIEIISSKYIFTNIRNIFDWLVSYAGHAGGWNPKYRNTDHYDFQIAQKGFDYLINTIADREFPWPCRKFLYFQIFASNGDMAVDWLNRMEYLDNDLKALAKFTGLSYKRRKKRRVGKRKKYQSYYTDSLIELVNRTWGREMRLYGYDYTGYHPEMAIIKREIDTKTKSMVKYNLSDDRLSNYN
jgi:hypothetical protein